MFAGAIGCRQFATRISFRRTANAARSADVVPATPPAETRAGAPPLLPPGASGQAGVVTDGAGAGPAGCTTTGAAAVDADAAEADGCGLGDADAADDASEPPGTSALFGAADPAGVGVTACTGRPSDTPRGVRSTPSPATGRCVNEPRSYGCCSNRDAPTLGVCDVVSGAYARVHE